MFFGQNSRREFFRAITAFFGIGASDSEGSDGHEKGIQKLNRNGFASSELVDDVVQSVDELRSITPDPKRVVLVKGYGSAGNGGGGLFWWDAGADAAAANGGTTIASTVTGYMNGDTDEGRWQRVRDGPQINVKWFGAVGDGNTDDTQAIKGAVSLMESENNVLYFPAGTYLTSETIVVSGRRRSVVGARNERVIIEKTTNTTTGFADAASGVTRDVDAVLMVDGGDGKAEGTLIEGLDLRHSAPNPVAYGLYVTQTFNSEYRDIHTRDVDVGLAARQIFTSEIVGCQARNTVSDGFQIGTIDVGVTSTSLTMHSCYALRCGGKGYRLEALNYSTLISCACDQAGSWPYLMNACKLTLSSCGFENNTTGKGIYATNSTITVVGADSFAIEASDTASDCQIRVGNSTATLISCQFADYTTSGGSAKLLAQGDSTVIVQNSTLPDNNGANIFLNDNSEMLRMNDATVEINTNQVLGDQVTDADLGNTINTGDAATDDAINAIIDVITTHGLGST